MESDKFIKILKLNNNTVLPKRATNGSAGLDLHANINSAITLKANESMFIPTGIAIEMPNDIAAFIFARSGLASKYGVALANGVGVIDSDYRGEICVIIKNFSSNEYVINKNDRIAQLIFMPICNLPIVEVNSLASTLRSSNGFGSTGK